MALQSEVSPHLVGDSNKVTQIEGDTKRSSIKQNTNRFFSQNITLVFFFLIGRGEVLVEINIYPYVR